MKKRFAFLLAAVMLLSFAACSGGNDLEAAAREIEKITGETITADDVKQTMEQLEALLGQTVTAQDVVDFTREMYDLAGGETTTEEWPLYDIPAWPVAEGLNWDDFYGENQIDIYVKGSEADMDAWLEELRALGFKGYYWGDDDLEYYSEHYWITLDDSGTGDGAYHLVVRHGDMNLGIPAVIADLFPAYNGDGVLVYDFYEESDGRSCYFFSALGETKEGGQRYLQALKDAGFEPGSDTGSAGAGGCYYKTVDDQKIGYESKEYWDEFDEETGTGSAEFCLTVAPN